MRSFTYILAVLLIMTAGCTKRFDQLNTDPTTFSSLTAATIPNAFAKAEYQGIYGDPGIYELARALFPDLWSQFFANVDPNVKTDRYVIVQDWIISQWSSVYTVTWPTLKQVLDATAKTQPEANAIAKVWKVYIWHYQTDFYGPVPYFQAGLGTLSIPYDSQQDIYDDLFKTLDSAVTVLKGANASLTPYGNNDLIFHGSIPAWTKLANSLRLRLALRISKADAARGKAEAEKAVADGVMTGNGDNAFMDVGPNSVNGLNQMSPWEGARMSASMESYLKGYNDPRMMEYYSPAADGHYHGVRNGLTAAQLGASGKNNPDSTSNVGPRYGPDSQATNKLTVMYAAESFFLRAEGALNGWNMGDNAQHLYEQGIRVSMQQWRVTDNTVIDDYISGNSTPIALSDYLSSDPVANIPVKFGATEAIQRQQIATQKYLALFPDGIEAWAEVRRTGWPVLYPVANSDNPDVSVPNMISRFSFLDYEYQTNRKAVQAAAPLLGGPDKASTKVWWNK
ncbi:MAG: SusD/RagB family nutrient-binding outer membrane lipoprotein [Chitinophagaceae bacterium]|nr:SusD/RagB family nutrient-binding outer membrane lipoprotein [Chitinophagaceae bacterium]